MIQTVIYSLDKSMNQLMFLLKGNASVYIENNHLPDSSTASVLSFLPQTARGGFTQCFINLAPVHAGNQTSLSEHTHTSLTWKNRVMLILIRTSSSRVKPRVRHCEGMEREKTVKCKIL